MLFINYKCIFLDFILEILSSNLFIALLIFFLGKKYIFDDFIKEKRAFEDLSIRKDVIYNLYQIESSILRFKVIFDRYIRTIKEVKISFNEVNQDIKDAFKKEADLLSKIINTDIPVNFCPNIETLIETYFIDKDFIRKNWSNYLAELKIIMDFAVLKLPKIMSSDKFAKDYDELNIDNLKQKKEDFTKIILSKKTIWNK